jgi:hypothetical protein
MAVFSLLLSAAAKARELGGETTTDIAFEATSRCGEE